MIDSHSPTLIDWIHQNQYEISQEWISLSAPLSMKWRQQISAEQLEKFTADIFHVVDLSLNDHSSDQKSVLAKMANNWYHLGLSLKEGIHSILLLKQAMISNLRFEHSVFDEFLPLLMKIDTCINAITADFSELYNGEMNRHLLEVQNDESIILSQSEQIDHPPLELHPVLERLTQDMMTVINACQGFIYLYNPQEELFYPYLTIGEFGLFEMQFFYSQPLHPSSDLLAQTVLDNKEMIISEDAAKDTRIFPSIVSSLGLTTILVSPIRVSKNILGMALLNRTEREPAISPEQIRLAASIANAMALALDNVHLYEETYNRLLESQSMHQVTLALVQELELKDVLALVCSEAQRLTGAMGSSVSLLEEQDWLSIAYHTGEVPHISTRFSLNDSLLGLVVRRGEPVLVNNHLSEEGLQDTRQPFSLLAIPLKVKGEIIGVLDVVNKHPGFTQEDVRLIELYANQAAVAIEHARLYKQVEEISVIEERQRLARELHDSVNQSLYAIVLYSEVANRQLASGNLDSVANHLETLLATAKDALGEMRLLIFGLRPPILEQQGLAAALQARLKTVEERAGLQTGFKSRLTDRLLPDLEKEIYGIAQEALNNILKHSKAKCVTLHLIQSGQILMMKIEDDGVGFDLQTALNSSGLGLKTMQERSVQIGGQLLINTEPDRGTTITLEVKL